MTPQFSFIYGLAFGLEHATVAIVDDSDDYMEPEVYTVPCWHISLGIFRVSLIFD